jgi:hypothetical protein
MTEEEEQQEHSIKADLSNLSQHGSIDFSVLSRRHGSLLEDDLSVTERPEENRSRLAGVMCHLLIILLEYLF